MCILISGKVLRQHLGGLLKEGHEFALVHGQAHATAAAPRCGLDHDREANLIGYLHGLCIVLDQPVTAWHGGHSSSLMHSR